MRDPDLSQPPKLTVVVGSNSGSTAVSGMSQKELAEMAMFAEAEAEDDSLGTKIKMLRLAKGDRLGRQFTQKDLGDIVGVTKGAVSQWENGAIPDEKYWPSIASALDTTVTKLFPDGVEKRKRERNEPNRGGLPVIGVKDSKAGDFQLTGSPIGFAKRPPGLARARSAFCFRMVGDSMAPVWEDGETVYVDPSRPAGSGDYVLIALKPFKDEEAPMLIRRLVLRDVDEIEVWQAASRKRETIKRDKIAKIQRVVRAEDLLN